MNGAKRETAVIVTNGTRMTRVGLVFADDVSVGATLVVALIAARPD
jgi:hypothetical protein